MTPMLLFGFCRGGGLGMKTDLFALTSPLPERICLADGIGLRTCLKLKFYRVLVDDLGGLGTLPCCTSRYDLGGSTEQLRGASDPLPPVLSTDRCVTDLPGLAEGWFILRRIAMNC